MRRAFLWTLPIALLSCTRAASVAPPAARASSAAPALPPNASFQPFLCTSGPADDPAGDTSSGGSERDIVGDATHPAVYRAVAGEDLYFRMRLDDTPLQNNGNLKSFGWGFEFDRDQDFTDYEFLLLANGVGSDQVVWQQNTVVNPPNDPRDPAELTLDTFAPETEFWSATVATDSNFAGTPDYFLTLRVPKALMTGAGVRWSCDADLWAATSSNGQVLDSDLACNDGNAGTPTLMTSVVGPSTPDPLGLGDLDGDGLITRDEYAAGTDPCDKDSDDDGVLDGVDGLVDHDLDGKVDALDPDSDNDGLPDGLEAGVTVADLGPWTDVTAGNFTPDADPSTTTDPQNPDTDGDGLLDGAEDANHNGRVDPGETDPNDFDTDDGGVGDGVEAGRDTDPLDPRDDFHAAGSGGCDVGGRAPVRGAAATLATMAALAAIAFRTRRRAVAGIPVVAVAVTLAAGNARAQTVPLDRDFALQQFRPAAGSDDVLSLITPRILPGGLWSVSIWANHASRPFRLVDPSNGDTVLDLVRRQDATDVSVSAGLFGLAEVGVTLPVTVDRAQGTSAAIPSGLRRGVRSSGVGDVRVQPKASLFEFGGTAIGVAVPFTIPTSAGRSFLGSGAAGATPMVVLEHDFRGRARVLVNGGIAFRKRADFLDVRVGNAAIGGIGAEIPFTLRGIRFSGVATLTGETPLGRRTEPSSPAEALGSLRWIAGNGIIVGAGAGRGLTNGYGSPEWRAIAGISFAPTRRHYRHFAAPELSEIPPNPGVLVLPNRLDVREKIYFETGKAVIRFRSYGVLGELAATLKAHPEIHHVRIEGHTDNVGSALLNTRLSQARADAVREYLVDNGVQPSRLEAVGYGDAKPLESNETEKGRSNNRRVEFVIVNDDASTTTPAELPAHPE